MGCLFAAGYFLWTLFYLIIVWPIRVVIAILAWFFSLIAYFPTIFILLAVTALMLPWTRYHDNIVENIEFVLRCRVAPVWTDVIRRFFELFRLIWNPMICWWNALQWFAFGWMQEVIWPIAIDGGIADTMQKLFIFINIFVRDFVAGYILSGDFLQERVYLDGPLSCGFIGCTSMCDAWIDFWQAWQVLVCTFCQDLCKVWALQGVLNPLLFIPYLGQLISMPILNPLALLGSNQLADRQFWCFLENALNLIFELLRIAWRIFVQLITTGTITERPDGRQFWKFACDAFTCYVRSMENLAQLFVDCFVPFTLNIAERPLEPDPLNRLGMFCILDTIFCILARSVDVILRLLIQIDRVVQYPMDPYFEEVIVEDWKAILNLWAEPSRFDDIIVAPYPLPTLGNPMFEGLTITDNYIPTDDPLSPIFGMHRLDECICVLIQRVICDPSNPDVACFDQGIASLFMDAMFDFCCLTNILARVICDVLMGVVELLLSFTSAQKFFFFIDRMPYLRVFKENVVDVVDCLVDGFSFIPEVGFCLKQIFVQIARFVLCIAEFLIRTILGLITLPYFLIELTNAPMYVQDNFITEPNLAKDTFIDIIEQFVGERADSFINCLCYLLNEGLPIPPLTVNGFCPTCTPRGYIVPPMILKDKAKKKEAAASARYFNDDFINKEWGSSHSLKITPILVYGNHSLTPILIRDNIFNAAISKTDAFRNFPSGLRSIDSYLSKRGDELLTQWRKEKECRKALYNDLWLKKENPARYQRFKDMGKLETSKACKNTTPFRRKKLESSYQERLINQERIAQRPTEAPLFSNCTIEEDGELITPPCFDLCCLFRAVFRLAGELLSFLARFINSLGQEWDTTRPGNNPQFPYFLGQSCQYSVPGDPKSLPLPGCFENDIRILVQRILDPVVCICRLIELLIPVIPQAPRPDLCCAITFLADLIGCILQVFINAIKSLALDGEISQVVLQSGPLVCDVGTVDTIGAILVGVGNCIIPSCDPGTLNMVGAVVVPDGYCRVLACDFGTDDTVFEINVGVGNCNAGEDGDGLPFSYFNANFFEQDIDILLDITVDIVDCLCNLFNAVFPMKALSNGVFDPCCIAMSAIRFATAVIRLALGVIVNVATLDAGGFCYWRIDAERCGDPMVYPGATGENPNSQLSELGFVKQVDDVISTLLTEQGGPCSNPQSSNTPGCQGIDTGDQGTGGILGCLCSIVSAIIPIRPDPTLPVGAILNEEGEENCPILDFCCLFRQLGFALQDGASFAVQGLASLWQKWTPGCDPGTVDVVDGVMVPVGDCVPGSGGMTGSPRPDIGIRYFFCDETSPFANNCGKLEPIIRKLQAFLFGCPCQFFAILDAVLDLIFPIPDNGIVFSCFCGPQGPAACNAVSDGAGAGVLCSTADLLEILATSALRFGRVAFSDVPVPFDGVFCTNMAGCTESSIFWSPPTGGGFLDANNNDVDDDGSAVGPQLLMERTFSSTFFGPIADAICRFLESTLCFLNSFLALPCPVERNTVVKAVVRWAFEIVIRIGAFIEGIVRVLVYEPTDAEDEVGMAPNSGTFGAPPGMGGITVTANGLGSVISQLLNVFVDAAIADSSTLCGFVDGSSVTTVVYEPCAITYGMGWMDMHPNCICGSCFPDTQAAKIMNVSRTICEPGDPFPCPMDLRCVANRCYIKQEPNSTIQRIECDIPDCGLCDSKACEDDATCQEKPLDGILLALFRYIQCFLGRAGLGQIMVPLIYLSSIFWQIIGAIIRFLVACFIFLFSLISIFEGGCSCHDSGGVIYDARGGLCYACTNFYFGANTSALYPGQAECFVTSFETGLPPGVGPLGSPALPVCSLFQIFARFTDVFTAFIDIFQSFEMIVPPALRRSIQNGDIPHDIERHVPYINDKAKPYQRLDQMPKRGRRIPIGEFKKRAQVARDHMIYDPKNMLEVIAEGLFDYDVSDCFNDPVACSCRNMHMPEMCTWHPSRGVINTKRDQPVTVEDVLHAANMHFGDNSDTVCAHTIKSCSSMPWSTIPESERIEWVTCMELRFQGERMNHMFKAWPSDFFYSKDGTYELLHNMLYTVKRSLFVNEMQTKRWIQDRTLHYARVQRNEEPLHPHGAKMRTKEGKVFNKQEYTKMLKQRAMWDKFVIHKTKERWASERENIFNDRKMKTGLFIKPTLQLDQMEIKYRSGYYTWLVGMAYNNWNTGNWRFPSWSQSLTHLRSEANHLYKTVRHAPYSDLGHSTVEAFHAVRKKVAEVKKEGVSNSWKKFRSTFENERTAFHKKKAIERRAMIVDSFLNSPFYKWWNTPVARTSPIKTLYNHVTNVMERNRKGLNGKRWFDWDHAYLKMARHIRNRFTNGTYTEENLKNWESFKRPFIKAYARMFPHHVTKDMEERFLINCDCRLIDESFALVKFLVEYCIGEFVDNLPPIQRNKIHPELKIMADNGWFINHPNVITKQKIETMKRDGTHDPDLHFLERWQRARVVHPKTQKLRAKDIPRRAWRRIMMTGQPFDLFDWLLCFIEDVFDSTISQDAADLIMDIQAWLENDNLDYLAGPVGLKYRLLFFWRCDFPLNLNCSIGIGLEAALGKVLLWSFIIFVGGSFLFPATLLPLIGFGAFLFYVIVVPMVAWHYSPRCWLMFPTMAFGLTTLIPPGMSGFTDFLIRLGEGVTVPIIPWPVAFPALPECLWDEIIHLLDTYLTTCYDFLEEKGLGWILPLCMVNGPICVTCDMKIDVANCADVGIRDGIQNLVFILNYWFPDLSMSIAQNIASTCLFNGCISDAFPFDFQYVLDLFESFQNANETQMCRQWWCFWATLPSIAFFIVLGILLFSLLGLIVPLIVDLVGAVWAVGVAFVMMVTSTGNVPGDETDANEGFGIDSRIGARVPRSAIGAFLEDKEERKSRRRRVVQQRDNYITGTLGRWVAAFAIKPLVKKLKQE